jgi:hypothetical protein
VACIPSFAKLTKKLQAIVAARKRHVLQSIQEETATNIYLPSPLQGLVGPDIASGVTMGPGGTVRQNKNTIWISGEFFGVQRARDMLLQLSLNKACLVTPSPQIPDVIVVIRARASSRGIPRFSQGSWTGW